MMTLGARQRVALLVRPARRALSRGSFPGSRDYWAQRYDGGDDSGAGSYGELAEFKAEVLNRFVKNHNVESVLEFGCGDGNQLSLAEYPRYTGLDVAPRAIENCVQRFATDPTKSFFLYSTQHFVDREGTFAADLTLSLDVVFHLVEDPIFETYMQHLFGAAKRFVIVYSSNDERPDLAAHVRHRRFTPWVETNVPQWRLLDHVQNPHRHLSAAVADFYIYEYGGLLDPDGHGPQVVSKID